MRLFPLRKCMQRADSVIGAFADDGIRAEVFQQFLCAHCGAKQTIDDPNTFHAVGKCEECGKCTNIERDGCNYLVSVGMTRRTAT